MVRGAHSLKVLHTVYHRCLQLSHNLVSPELLWGCLQAGTRTQGVFRVAAYLLAPHYFVALTLAKHFRLAELRDRWSDGLNKCLQGFFFLLLVSQLLADVAACLGLGMLLVQLRGGFAQDSRRSSPAALIVGYSITAVGFALFGPLSVLTTVNSVWHKWRTMTIMEVLPSAAGGILLLAGCVYGGIGAILLALDIDVYCSSYFLSSIDCIHGDCKAGSCVCDPYWGGETCDVVDRFSGSQLITAQWGNLLVNWASLNDTRYELCYSSFTDYSDTPAVFHERCDAYSTTFVVARNSHGNTFGGYVRSTPSCHSHYVFEHAFHATGCYRLLPSCFVALKTIFQMSLSHSTLIIFG